MKSRPIYLDHAAATPLDSKVLQAMQPYFAEDFYNPSALYLRAKQVGQDIAIARQSVAKVLGTRPVEVVFTAGGTEANNLAIHGIMQQFPGSNMVTSRVEHESVLGPAKQYSHKLAEVDATGRIRPDELIKLIDTKTVLVSVMYANNELGTIQPLAELSKLINHIRAQRAGAGNTLPLYFHTDACQAANYLPLLIDRHGVDLLTLNGGKIYGPKQSGCLYVRTGTRLKPQILGGGQERGMRSGTENVASIVGFAAALSKAQNLREAEASRLQLLKQQLLKNLAQQAPSIVVTVKAKHTLPSFVHIHIPGADNERLIMELDEQGIMAAAGSACSASNDEASHVLLAIGMSEAEARSSIRFSMGRTTMHADINALVSALARLDDKVYTADR